MIVTLLTIVFLIAMWVAVLAAPVLQNRGSGNRGGDSIKTFQRQLATLERSAPVRSPLGGRVGAAGRGTRSVPRQVQPHRPVGAPPVRRAGSTSRAAAQRRRRVLGALAGTALLTLVLALTVGGWFVIAHLVADVLLGAFIALIVRTLRIAAEREMKVAFLPHRQAGAEPTALLQHDVARANRG